MDMDTDQILETLRLQDDSGKIREGLRLAYSQGYKLGKENGVKEYRSELLTLLLGV